MGKSLPPPAVGDWAQANAVPQPGLDRRAWKGRLEPEQQRRAMAGYLGCIANIDYQLGYLAEMLAGKGLWQNTLVLFTADHGDMMGDHHMHRKSYAYEGSARIPFAIRYPTGSDLPTGSFGQVVGLRDVMPTLLEAAETVIPQSVTGRSVFSAVKGEKWREFFHGEHSPCYALEHGMHYLTDGREKYIWYPVTGEEQFFDLTTDRKELHNLVGDNEAKQRIGAWRKRLVELLGRRGDGFSDGKTLLRKDKWYGPLSSREADT
jgi:arylsulfatase A-like enzyme